MPNGNIDRFIDLLPTLREIIPAGDGEIVALRPEGSVYQFEAASLISEDGYQILKPSDRGILLPGRWVKKDLAFGAHYQREESPGMSSNSGATFADKLQLFAQNRNGDYRLSWSARVATTGATGSIEVEILEGNTQVDLYAAGPGITLGKTFIGGNFKRNLNGSNTLYRMRFRKPVGTGDVTIEKAVLEFVRIGS